jgi:hypothetical protein
VSRFASSAAAGLVCAAFAAPAAAQTPDSCARFEAPLAYNACLAAHGPKAGATRPAAHDGEAGGPARRARPGRQRLEFNVGD